MIYAYRRQTPNCSSLVEQQHEIQRFSIENTFTIDKEVIEYATKNLLLEEREAFEAFLRNMGEGYTIIVASLSVLSNRADELIKVINCVLTHKVNLWIANTALCINQETQMVDIFPLLNALREEHKEDKSKQMGRPKGSKSNSKFDVFHGQIVNLLAEGMSVSAIARELEISRSSLKDYIESRSLKDLAMSMHSYLKEDHGERGLDNVVLICPFEEAYNNRMKQA
jgi:DNA invertase Pin-like site-specific DNA recombinase